MASTRSAWGGSRPGSGRAVRIIRLDAETARLLRILKLQAGTDEHTLVRNLIHQAWSELDESYQSNPQVIAKK